MEIPKTAVRERENEGGRKEGERAECSSSTAALARQKKGFSQIKEARQAS